MRLLLLLVLTAATGWLLYSMKKTGEDAGGVHASGVEQVDPGALPGGGTGLRAPEAAQPVEDLEQPEPISANPFAAGDRDQAPAAGVVTPAALDASAYAAAAELLAGRGSKALEITGNELDSGRRLALAAFMDGLEGRGEAARDKAAQLFDQGYDRARDLDMLKVVAGLERLPLPYSAQAPDALDLAQEALLYAASAERLLERRRFAEAARHVSRSLILAFEINGPVAASRLEAWASLLRRAQAKHRWNPNGEWPHLVEEIQPGDSLQAIRARVVKAHPHLRINTGLIATVNGMSESSVIHPGKRMRIPTDPITSVVDVDSRFMLVMHGEEVVEAWSVGVGRDEKPTPIGEFRVGNKQFEPVWFREGKDPLPFGHRDNELGTRWIGWRYDGQESDTDIGFHGTNAPPTIGKNLGAGCVRLQNPAVERLYAILPRDSVIISQP